MGTTSDIEMAKFVANFLSERFMSLWYKYRELTNSPISSREAFFVGLYRGLNDKLKKTKEAAEST
ncbi:DUF7168 domain-containing protein, partial [Klebsiella variicola]|uniref:DUF7168 domain-containing protein n=1 Tax=Klebsiella variicola TaxID=244366 RepID=UPI00406BA42E